MKQFNVKEGVTIICEWKKTRMGFKHEATLLVNGIEQEKTKICYQNRTWERYEYESVMLRLLEKTNILTEEEKKIFLENANKEEHERVNQMFGSIGAIAKLGEIMCETKKEKNDWKLRMLKAGLENKGLDVPEDWETLTEEEKETRLNKIIKELRRID